MSIYFKLIKNISLDNTVLIFNFKMKKNTFSNKRIYIIQKYMI